MSATEHVPDRLPHAAHAHPPVRLLWWAYFALLGADWVASVLAVRTVPDGLDVAFWGVALVGLFGYLRRQPLGPRRLWSGYAALYVLWLLSHTGFEFWRSLHAGLLALLAATILVLLVFGPMAWALWRYATHCPELWPRDGSDGARAG